MGKRLKINEGKRCVSFGSLHAAAFHVGVANGLSQFRPADGCISAKRFGPSCILPAVSRFQFLRGDHVVGKSAHCVCRVQRGHQAGVETDDIKGWPRRGRRVDALESLSDFL